jgi:membrane protein DedA with SNARE-associated domain|uniref:Putative membrane SNARE associated-like protein n=1 Tax=uncultured marine thaumarchaeote KM3_90_C11 TaxID=1456342 RepID=A0A075HYA5_9ARCH|nr:putative membrane SNARE associated-like protein [uncultured marine thaumarchaeote KM3_90_C11]|tara:strand:+ start:113 stop:637 length:525 start_codon:yes stop_codon:yes gene_type:complete
MPLESLIELITTLIEDYLFLGVFLAALIETIIPPIPTMAVFPTAGFIASQNGLELPELFLLGIVGGLGASIGSTLIYLIALKLGRTALLRYLKRVKVSEKKLTRVEYWFQKYGDKAVLFGRMIPVFREIVSIPAGLLKMKLPKFLAYTILGSCGWSITLIFIGYYFGIASLEFW